LSPQLSQDLPITAPSYPNLGTRKLQVRSLKYVPDSRFTSACTVNATVQRGQNRVDIHVAVTPTGTQPARFKASWLVGWSEVDDFDLVWVDDQTPPGATLGGDGEGWDWRPDNAFSGTSAHQSALSSGMHQHYFSGAANPMKVNAPDFLFAMVYLDPDNPPDELMLQWHTPTGWLRAYWGDDALSWGTDGTPDRLRIGPLPPSGEWIRLEVGAQSLGIKNASVDVDGMAFTLFGGRATWDYAGRNNAGEIVQ
jgi:hypothetical protein